MIEHNIIDFFQKKYEIFSDNYHFRMAEADFSNKTKREVINIIVNLFKTIKKGYGVIGGIVRQDDTSHGVILFRDQNGYSYIIDAQSNEMFQSRPSKDSKSFGDFFYGNRVKKLFYLTAHNTKDGRILLIDEERQSMIFEDALDGPPNKIEEEEEKRKERERRRREGKEEELRTTPSTSRKLEITSKPNSNPHTKSNATESTHPTLKNGKSNNTNSEPKGSTTKTTTKNTNDTHHNHH